MFIRLSKYLETVEARVAAEAVVSLLRAQLTEKDGALTAVQKELRRLTDIIVHLKREGRVLDPIQGDERWPGGRYTFSDIEREAEVPPPQVVEREVDATEAELRAELNRVFDEG